MVVVAQGVTADSSYAILGEGSSRAMGYVAMTRGRHNNEAFLYQKVDNEADHEDATPVTDPAIHQLRPGNKYSAAYHFKQILHNDDRPRTMHAEAQRTDRALLPGRVADMIQRHEARRPHPHGHLARTHQNRGSLPGRLRTDGRRGSNSRRTVTKKREF